MKREDEKKQINELISYHASTNDFNFDAICEDEQQELIGAYILSKDIDEAWEIFTEHNERYLPFVIGHQLMQDESLLLMRQLIDAIKPYVRDGIQKLFDTEKAKEPLRLKDAHTDTLFRENKDSMSEAITEERI